jgi:hypothetical protein
MVHALPGCGKVIEVESHGTPGGIQRNDLVAFVVDAHDHHVVGVTGNRCAIDQPCRQADDAGTSQVNPIHLERYDHRAAPAQLASQGRLVTGHHERDEAMGPGDVAQLTQ